MSEIETIKEAINPTINLINKRFQEDRVEKVYPVNNARHYILRTKKGMGYQLIFKRDFFNSFGKIFDNFEGAGESVNKKVVKEALEKDIHNFLFVYPEGKIYAISPKEFNDFAEKHDLERKTSSGEVTYSIPVKMLRRWK